MLLLAVVQQKGNKGFLGTAKFHLIQGVLSHMGGKEVGREGGIQRSSIN